MKTSSHLPLVAAGLAGAALYTAASLVFFQMPTSLAEAELCGFLPHEFDAGGAGLGMDHTAAWWLAYRRQQDYFSALSIGLALAFVVFALRIGRQAGLARGARGAAAAGGGLLAFSALCVSCLAPVLSVVGLGLAGSWIAEIPKWLIALNTLLLTGWGALLLSRRGASCPLPQNQTQVPPAGHRS